MTRWEHKVSISVNKKKEENFSKNEDIVFFQAN